MFCVTTYNNDKIANASNYTMISTPTDRASRSTLVHSNITTTIPADHASWSTLAHNQLTIVSIDYRVHSPYLSGSRVCLFDFLCTSGLRERSFDDGGV